MSNEKDKSIHFLFADHHVDDFFVGFFHADAAETADIADGVFDAF